jgi:hypothetical protein
VGSERGDLRVEDNDRLWVVARLLVLVLVLALVVGPVRAGRVLVRVGVGPLRAVRGANPASEGDQVEERS